MKKYKHVTLKEIAEACGVTTATVSMALRNSPRISEETRKRVQDQAKALNWSPNPLLSRLMTQLQQQKTSDFQESIALLTAYEKASTEEEVYLVDLFQGVQERTTELGYQVDILNARNPRLSAKRLTSILEARGIRGFVLAPFREGVRHLSMDYLRFASCAASVRLMRPEIDCVVPDHFHNILVAVKRLLHMGYRRIAFVTVRENIVRNEFRWLGAWYAAHYTAGLSIESGLVFCPENFSEEGFQKWFHNAKPEVLVSTLVQAHESLLAMGLDLPGDVGYVATSCGQKQYPVPVSGIDEQPRMIGRLTSDLLVSRLTHNEIGVPVPSKIVMVKGDWTTNASVRHMDRKR